MSNSMSSNQGLKVFERNAPFDEVTAALDADGAAIVKDFVNPDLLARLNRELDPNIERTRPGALEGAGEMEKVFIGEQTKRLSSLINYAPSCAEILEHDLFNRWADHAFVGQYWLSASNLMVVGPGSKPQVVHRDLDSWPIFETLGKEGPECLVSMMLALTDFTEDVGATRVIPGSNRWDFSRPAKGEKTFGAVMSAGSALLYSGKVLHAAGANTTEKQWRRGLYVGFCPVYLTPLEATPIAVPWETAKKYSPHVQKMLGYASQCAYAKKGVPVNWMINLHDVRRYLGVEYERNTGAIDENYFKTVSEQVSAE